MPFQIIRNDITKVKADAIVNTANPNVAVGNGTDRAIYYAAGKEQLLTERKKIGIMMPGQVAHTPAFNLSAKYIIHTIGPAWIDGGHNEREILHSCYEKSLALAVELECTSVAFPLIATGVYGFPKDEALQIALAEINKFLLSHDMKVILVVFDKKAFELSGKLIGDIEEYIDEHSADEIRDAEYGGRYGNDRRRRLERLEYLHASRMEEPIEELELEEDEAEEVGVIYTDAAPAFPDISGMSLDEVVESEEDTFQQRLFKLIDESGMDDVTVYKKYEISGLLITKY